MVLQISPKLDDPIKDSIGTIDQRINSMGPQAYETERPISEGVRLAYERANERAVLIETKAEIKRLGDLIEEYTHGLVQLGYGEFSERARKALKKKEEREGVSLRDLLNELTYDFESDMTARKQAIVERDLGLTEERTEYYNKNIMGKHDREISLIDGEFAKLADEYEGIDNILGQCYAYVDAINDLNESISNAIGFDLLGDRQEDQIDDEIPLPEVVTDGVDDTVEKPVSFYGDLTYEDLEMFGVLFVNEKGEVKIDRPNLASLFFMGVLKQPEQMGKLLAEYSLQYKSEEWQKDKAEKWGKGYLNASIINNGRVILKWLRGQGDEINTVRGILQNFEDISGKGGQLRDLGVESKSFIRVLKNLERLESVVPMAKWFLDFPLSELKSGKAEISLKVIPKKRNQYLEASNYGFEIAKKFNQLTLTHLGTFLGHLRLDENVSTKYRPGDEHKEELYELDSYQAPIPKLQRLIEDLPEVKEKATQKEMKRLKSYFSRDHLTDIFNEINQSLEGEVDEHTTRIMRRQVFDFLEAVLEPIPDDIPEKEKLDSFIASFIEDRLVRLEDADNVRLHFELFQNIIDLARILPDEKKEDLLNILTHKGDLRKTGTMREM